MTTRVRHRPAWRAVFVLTAAAVLTGVVSACAGPPSGASTSAPPTSVPSATSDLPPLPPLPTSAFPGLTCDALVAPATVAALLGDGATPQSPTVDDAPILQDGGAVCTWAGASAGTSLTVRLTGDGVDHWATFNHWYEHTDWNDDVGEINGTMCSDGACSVHALDGERFIEVEVAGVDDPSGTRTEEVARAAFAAAPTPTPVPAPSSSSSSRSRSCVAALPVDTASAVLDRPDGGASYVSTATPSYHLAQDSLARLGGVDCRLLSADSRELLRFTVLPGGAWLFRDEAPIDDVDADGSGNATPARRGDDWVRLQAPGAEQETVQALLADLLG